MSVVTVTHTGGSALVIEGFGPHTILGAIRDIMDQNDYDHVVSIEVEPHRSSNDNSLSGRNFLAVQTVFKGDELCCDVIARHVVALTEQLEHFKGPLILERLSTLTVNEARKLGRWQP